jgi:hypothetical protein
MPKYRPLPPLGRLNELLEVVEIPSDKFGVWSGLVWRVSRGGQRAGSVAGCPCPTPSNPERLNWTVRVDGASYFASRVIYYMSHGKDPGDTQIDHQDQNWLNNNTWNLRLDVDGSIQQVNRPTRRDNTSGVPGVCWDKTAKKWMAYVNISGKMNNLGRFTCKTEAARVVRNKWIELGWEQLGRKLPKLNKIYCICGNCK